jgi:hypothetical protein
MALPADPSRADATVRIHHHGSEASTVVMVAVTLRSSSFMVPLVSGRHNRRAGAQTVGSIALALLLCSGSN